MDELYTAKEVSKVLKVNVHKVYDLIKAALYWVQPCCECEYRVYINKPNSTNGKAPVFDCINKNIVY